MRVFLPLIALAMSQPALANGPSDNSGELMPKTIVLAHDRCVLSDEGAPPAPRFFGALLALVAPTLIKLSIDAAVAELEKVRTVKSSGSAEAYLFEVPIGQRSLQSDMPNCITMVTGSFKGHYGQAEIKPGASNSGLLPPQADANEILTRLGNHITLDPKDNAVRLYSVLELKIIQSDDGTAFRYRPAYMRVFNLMPGNRANQQGLLYNVSIAGPGASPDGSVYSLAPISFGSVGPGFEVTDSAKAEDGSIGTDPALTAALASRQTGWLTIPGMSDSARYSYFRNLTDGTVGGTRYMPVSIKAEVIQTQKPSNAAKLLAKILSGAKDGIATKVGELVAPTDDFAASQAILAAQAAVEDAKAAYTAAQNADNPDANAIEAARLKLEIAQNALDNLQ